MAYGRLDIYWPDGKVETVMLDDETISVGRAEGNTIPLDTDTISRYHFSLIYDADADTVSITDLDSANGTYMDGSPLQSNEPHPMGDVEELQAGALRIIFRKLDNQPTVAMSQVDEDTQRIEREEADYHLELDHRAVDVWPAASSSVELAVTNTADEKRHFSVRISGMPGEWMRINRPELTLDAGDTGYVLIHIKPPRRHTTTPTNYQVTVEVEPTESPEMRLTAALGVHVRGFSGFGIATVPQAAPGEPATIFLHNQGSEPLSLSLSATDPQKALRFTLPSKPLELQAGQRMRVEMDVNARNMPLVGSPETYPFIVQARAQNAAGFIAATSGTVQITPRLPVWGAVTVGGIAMSIVAVVLVALLGLLNPPNPQIDSLELMTTEVAQGDMLEIAMLPRDARTIDIAVNNELVAQGLPGDTTSYAIPTDNYSGMVTIEVIAQNGSISNRQTITAQVSQPMQIAEFTITPAPLVHNVVADVSIVWDVPGAARVRLAGLNDFTRGLYQSSTEYEPVGSLDGVTGVPDEPLTVTLYAEDEAGNILEESRTVNLIEPMCTTVTDVALREGPAENYQQVSSVPEGISLVVEAQDAEAGWLRVQVPDSDVRVWGAQSAFECNDNFSLSNLVIESDLPATPTPVTPLDATPTALPTSETASATPGSTPAVTANPTNAR